MTKEIEQKRDSALKQIHDSNLTPMEKASSEAFVMRAAEGTNGLGQKEKIQCMSEVLFRIAVKLEMDEVERKEKEMEKEMEKKEKEMEEKEMERPRWSKILQALVELRWQITMVLLGILGFLALNPDKLAVILALF